MFQRIVLALDSGDTGAVATSYAISLARGSRSEVRVVHVNQYLFARRGVTAESVSEAADVVAGALCELQSSGVRASGVTYRTTVFDVAATIAEVAESWCADLIVTGSRRRRFAFHLRRGIRERLTRCTSLPVLTAPAPLRLGRKERVLERSAAPWPKDSSLSS